MKDSPTAPLASLPKTIPNPGLSTAPRSIPTHPASCRLEPPARTRPGTLQGLLLAPLLLAGLALALTTSVRAQTMPQDTWRYDNVQFTSTIPGASLRCLATGMNGTSEYIYAAEGSAAEGPPNKVVRFNYDGTNQIDFASGFGYILGIACDSAGNVYVLDRSDSTVKKFKPDGVADGAWDGSLGIAGALNLTGATGTSMIAVGGGGDPAASGDDEIFVCDPGNSRIQVFAPDGTYKRIIGGPGPLPSQFDPGYPQIVLTTPDGRVLSMRDGGTSIIWNAYGTHPQTPPFPQTGTFVSQQVGAVTPDGLFVSIAPGTNSHLAARDMTGAVVSSFEFTTNLGPYIYGLTVSRRGDVIGCIGGHPRPTIIRVMEREYASVQNGLTPPAIPHPIVLGVSQPSGTTELKVDYLVSDADTATVETALLAFENGGNSLASVVPMTGLVVDIDPSIVPPFKLTPNTTQSVTWNMTSWSAGFGQLQVEVLAKDSRALLGTHWITVPADPNDSNSNEIKVSSRPVTDAELLDLWYWLIATKDSKIEFVDTGTGKGTVKRKSDSVTLAYSPTPTTSVTTSDGREFLYGRLNVRKITDAEITRVQSSNYGFTSVTVNSVVSDP